MRTSAAIIGVGLFCSAQAKAQAPPSFDDLWAGTAAFTHVRKFSQGDPALPNVNAGTRVNVINGTWYLFGRDDSVNVAQGNCPQGIISINVRTSTDQGATWGSPQPVATPDLVSSCMFADGSAYYDAAAGVWHYIVQELPAVGGWALSHFTATGSDPTTAAWVGDPLNPVVTGGQLFGPICAGEGKHCAAGMVDEGTPQIAEMRDGYFYITFHGYDYDSKAAARGVARTSGQSWAVWETVGADLPGDVLFSSLDCQNWNVSWDPSTGCIGSGEASLMKGDSGALYQVIEATDVALTCDITPGNQWWPLGLVRSPAGKYLASPQWEQEPQATPFMAGPHVGCSLQYTDLWKDGAFVEGSAGSGATWFGVWALDFEAGCAAWHMYELTWGAGPAPMPWPGGGC